jgi:hypothetical protein
MKEGLLHLDELLSSTPLNTHIMHTLSILYFWCLTQAEEVFRGGMDMPPPAEGDDDYDLRGSMGMQFALTAVIKGIASLSNDQLDVCQQRLWEVPSPPAPPIPPSLIPSLSSFGVFLWCIPLCPAFYLVLHLFSALPCLAFLYFLPPFPSFVLFHPTLIHIHKHAQSYAHTHKRKHMRL